MYYGFNGENWFDAQDEISKQWVIESIPEGKTFTLRFRADKPDFNPLHLSMLQDLAESFSAADRHLSVIYCANVQADAITQFIQIQSLIAAGVDIIAVEFGNEEYAASQSNFNFETYQGWFTPLKDLVESSIPTMKFLVFLAPRPKESGVLGGRKDHSTFNNKAIEYINLNANCFPTVHIYFNTRECPVRNTPLTPRVYDNEVFDIDLAVFYTTLMDQALSNLSLWDKTLDYITQNTGKPVFITEWGFDNYGDVKNTITLGKVAWTIWNKYGRDERIFALLQHNGLSKAGPGMIFPRHPKYDFAGEGANLPRVDYYVYKMFRLLDELPIYDGTTVIDTPTKMAVIADGGSTIQIDPTKVVLSSVEGTFIGGKNAYTTAGATEWMANGTKPSYDLVINDNPEGLNFFVEAMILTTDVVLDINELPTAVITAPDTTITGTTVRFDGSNSFDTDGTIINYRWFNNNGDVVISAVDAFYIETSFQTSGTYTMYLEVTDSKGATATTSKSITVTEAPKPCPWYCTLFPWLKKCNCAKTKIS